MLYSFYQMLSFLTQGASRSYHICFVTTHSRWTTTASWADASHLQQPQLVNNPGYIFYFFAGS